LLLIRVEVVALDAAADADRHGVRAVVVPGGLVDGHGDTALLGPRAAVEAADLDVVILAGLRVDLDERRHVVLVFVVVAVDLLPAGRNRHPVRHVDRQDGVEVRAERGNHMPPRNAPR
jgi:hypothetical protein